MAFRFAHVFAEASGDGIWGGLLCVGFIVVVFGCAVLALMHEGEMIAKMSPEEREKYVADMKENKLVQERGSINPAMVCPHCQIKGMVRTKAVVQKKGISGGKATAALVTGGLSVLATGLSRKEGVTQAYCGGCNNIWFF